MFQTNQGPSFPAHQFLFSGTSAPDTDPNTYYNWFAAENNSSEGGQAGCVAGMTTTVKGINTTGGETTMWYAPPEIQSAPQGYPCYSHPSMADVLNTAKISWKYYTQSPYGIWTAPVAIDLLCVPSGFDGTCLGSTFTGTSNTLPNVTTPAAQIFNDIQTCQLPQVSWITPDGNWSDHPGTNMDGSPTLGFGASWVADIINAIGNGLPGSTCPPPDGPYWSNTVILVTWDDWGGWHDHVSPPDCITNPCSGYSNRTGEQYVYGFRVPLLVVSPYTSAGYVSGAWTTGPQPTTCPISPPQYTQYCHDFGSILNFIEYVFGSGGNSLGYVGGKQPAYPYADYLALDGPNDPTICPTSTCPYSLSDFFNFKNSPRTFVPISAPVPTAYFTGYGGTAEDPDDDAVE